ncbi:hypothetical protein LXM25_16255 [Dyadobacter sp. LJ53]|uniref:hypothetical protein n=1 Tax=Dyadobacter chenwenxiniae TaxID=2906456 RepID=UPI001F4528EB|nr:hypothetical protein [Dyadobacter chenwenxiniae]MCF0051622.1 hypothetical protein [Dyadobacter chenwenxiniae]
MKPQVDVGIAFYGKPYQTIVTIKSLIQHSGQYIDKIYISRERRQPHNDYIGIFKVVDYFRNDPNVRLVIHYPYHHLGLGVIDLQRAKNDTSWRQSIMYQYALETTKKNYLCIMHNDMLFHDDMIGIMLQQMTTGPENLIGIGSIGQCWSCPAGSDWANKCNPHVYEDFVPTYQEAMEITEAYATPRQQIQKNVISGGRVHIMPECRLNEYCAMINVESYRRETIPDGDIGCYGGNWGGVDNATVWSHDVYQKGYRFKHLRLEDYTRHAPFDSTSSGTQANDNRDLYLRSEANAREYIENNYGPIKFSGYVQFANSVDSIKRNAWLTIIHTYGYLKGLVKK